MKDEFEPAVMGSTTGPRPKRKRSAWVVATIVVAVVLVGLLVAIVFGGLAPAGSVETSALAGQGGEGVWSNDAVTLERKADRLIVTLSAPRPDPGTYKYPLPETPDGEPTPMEGPGTTEVFTLWIFIFNRPVECKDTNVCRMVDIVPDPETGEAPAAQGAVYQLDSTIADGDWLDMAGEIIVGSPSNVGSVLSKPFCAQVHVGMAPHGKALTGADLESQLSDAIGNPDFWWPAQFETINPAYDC